jgi:type IV pilus assembly protein PilE
VSNAPLRTPAGKTRGFTLVELMVAMAILAVVATIAIPTYQGYVREGHYSVIRSTLNSMRVPIEDFRLENGNYGAVATLDTFAAIDGRFGLDADTEFGSYDYAVAVNGADSYDVWGQFGSEVWVRCENRFGTCCDSDTPGASAANNACPP